MNAKRAVTEEKTLTFDRSIVKRTSHSHSAETDLLIFLTIMWVITADPAQILIQGHRSTWMSLAFGIPTEGTDFAAEETLDLQVLCQPPPELGDNCFHYRTGNSCLPAHISFCWHSETHVCQLLAYPHPVSSACSASGHVLLTYILHWGAPGKWLTPLLSQTAICKQWDEMKQNLPLKNISPYLLWSSSFVFWLFDWLFFVRRRRNAVQCGQTGRQTISFLSKIRGFLIIKCLVLRRSNILSYIKYTAVIHCTEINVEQTDIYELYSCQSYSSILTGPISVFHSPLSVLHEHLDFSGKTWCWVPHTETVLPTYMTMGVL